MVIVSMTVYLMSETHDVTFMLDVRKKLMKNIRDLEIILQP
ncbi:MAG: hypothetical protein ACTSV7_10445 [Candidatus Baldrarchaeia archaeon]